MNVTRRSLLSILAAIFGVPRAGRSGELGNPLSSVPLTAGAGRELILRQVIYDFDLWRQREEGHEVRESFYSLEDGRVIRHRKTFNRCGCLLSSSDFLVSGRADLPLPDSF